MTVIIECADFHTDTNFTIDFASCNGGEYQCLNVTIDTSVPIQTPSILGRKKSMSLIYYKYNHNFPYHISN